MWSLPAVCGVLLLLSSGTAVSAPAVADSFRLSEQCPPSFEKTAAGVCELRNMYQFYDSFGVGLITGKRQTTTQAETCKQIWNMVAA